MDKKSLAFTLAEVLIVMNIIGTVAAMTLPTILHNVQEQECISGLQNAYSILSQATNAISAEKGGPPNEWGVTNIQEMYDLYKSHLSLTKDCGTNPGCFAQGASTGSELYTFDDKTDHYKMVLANGMNICFNSFHKDFDVQSGGTYNVGLYLTVDVNGKRLPNKFARDVVHFTLKPNGLVPTGCDYNSCTTTYYYGCTCKVFKNKKWLD